MLQTNCGILADPMGTPDSVQKSQAVPVVHPVIKVSIDHFRNNTAYVDGRYRVIEEQRRAYKYTPEVTYDDIIGLVVYSKNSTLILFY